LKSLSNRTYGLILVTIAAVLWSTAGLFVRLLGDMDTWTILAWRSLFAAISLAIVLIWQNGSNTVQSIKAIGKPGLIAIPIAAISMIAYVVALKLTTVANVMVIYSTTPFLAAGIAFIWLGEKSKWYVLLASLIALIGITIMAMASTRPDDIMGNLVAFLMTFMFAVQLVMARKYQSLQMGPINAIAATICVLLCLPLVSAQTPSPNELITLALFGVTTTAAAYSLFLLGGRHVPSGEAGFIGLIDVILGPLWVWLLFNENPGQAALIGGTIVLAAVVFYLVASTRQA
jgi:drug/metabolite transporter (DMT)-like permease